MGNGKKKEFLAAYDQYAEAIYRHCYFRVFSPGRAEELVQETFLKTWQYLQAGNSVRNIRVFLYRVASNLIVDEARKRKEPSLEALTEESDAFEPSISGRDELERGVLLRAVRERMKELPEEDRKILTMRYIDDLDPKDIGEILGMSANNVSVRLNRAVKGLRAEFGQP